MCITDMCLSCASCSYGCWQKLQKRYAYWHHTPAAHVWEMRKMFLGFLPSFFCKQELWSWNAAILQDSMPSVLLHLLPTLRSSFFLVHGFRYLSECYVALCQVGQIHNILVNFLLWCAMLLAGQYHPQPCYVIIASCYFSANWLGYNVFEYMLSDRVA